MEPKRFSKFFPINYKNIIFNGKNWKYYINSDIHNEFVIIGIYILIPEFFKEKLKYFNITFHFGENIFKFRLDILGFIQKKIY